MKDISIRPAKPEDAAAILRFIRELAEFERLAHEVVATEESLRATLFGPGRVAEAIIAERAGAPMAFALFFHNYSTFLARPGLYIEDVYVTPSARGSGIGGAIFKYLARLAVERGCGRMEWSCLDWNENALRFYRGLGAEPLTQWTVQRLTGDALGRVAAE